VDRILVQYEGRHQQLRQELFEKYGAEVSSVGGSAGGSAGVSAEGSAGGSAGEITMITSVRETETTLTLPPQCCTGLEVASVRLYTTLETALLMGHVLEKVDMAEKLKQPLELGLELPLLGLAAVTLGKLTVHVEEDDEEAGGVGGRAEGGDGGAEMASSAVFVLDTVERGMSDAGTMRQQRQGQRRRRAKAMMKALLREKSADCSGAKDGDSQEEGSGEKSGSGEKGRSGDDDELPIGSLEVQGMLIVCDNYRSKLAWSTAVGGVKSSGAAPLACMPPSINPVPLATGSGGVLTTRSSNIQLSGGEMDLTSKPVQLAAAPRSVAPASFVAVPLSPVSMPLQHIAVSIQLHGVRFRVVGRSDQTVATLMLEALRRHADFNRQVQESQPPHQEQEQTRYYIQTSHAELLSPDDQLGPLLALGSGTHNDAGADRGGDGSNGARTIVLLMSASNGCSGWLPPAGWWEEVDARAASKYKREQKEQQRFQAEQKRSTRSRINRLTSPRPPRPPLSPTSSSPMPNTNSASRTSRSNSSGGGNGGNAPHAQGSPRGTRSKTGSFDETLLRHASGTGSPNHLAASAGGPVPMRPLSSSDASVASDLDYSHGSDGSNPGDGEGAWNGGWDEGDEDGMGGDSPGGYDEGGVGPAEGRSRRKSGLGRMTSMRGKLGKGVRGKLLKMGEGAKKGAKSAKDKAKVAKDIAKTKAKSAGRNVRVVGGAAMGGANNLRKRAISRGRLNSEDIDAEDMALEPASPTSPTSPTTPELAAMTMKLGLFYKAHNPAKCEDRFKVGRAFEGEEPELNAELRKTYGTDLASITEEECVKERARERAQEQQRQQQEEEQAHEEEQEQEQEQEQEEEEQQEQQEPRAKEQIVSDMLGIYEEQRRRLSEGRLTEQVQALEQLQDPADHSPPKPSQLGVGLSVGDEDDDEDGSGDGDDGDDGKEEADGEQVERVAEESVNGDAEGAVITAQMLTSFYMKHDPSAVVRVDGILEAYSSSELDVALKEKYGAGILEVGRAEEDENEQPRGVVAEARIGVATAGQGKLEVVTLEMDKFIGSPTSSAAGSAHTATHAATARQQIWGAGQVLLEGCCGGGDESLQANRGQSSRRSGARRSTRSDAVAIVERGGAQFCSYTIRLPLPMAVALIANTHARTHATQAQHPHLGHADRGLPIVLPMPAASAFATDFIAVAVDAQLLPTLPLPASDHAKHARHARQAEVQQRYVWGPRVGFSVECLDKQRLCAQLAGVSLPACSQHGIDLAPLFRTFGDRLRVDGRRRAEVLSQAVAVTTTVSRPSPVSQSAGGARSAVPFTAAGTIISSLHLLYPRNAPPTAVEVAGATVAEVRAAEQAAVLKAAVEAKEAELAEQAAVLKAATEAREAEQAAALKAAAEAREAERVAAVEAAAAAAVGTSAGSLL
jgi:hypothetical protein